MRVPEERLGDLNASFASCRVAEKRILEICERYGVDQLMEAVRLDMDRAEARMRASIDSLPNGTYYYEDYLETFIGGNFEPLLLPLALTIQDDRMIADFSGASAQVPFPVNSTAAVSAASVFIAVKSVFDPAAPLNQGSFRPIEVVTPPGTIVNVQRPAPAGSHGEIRKRVIATMIGALSQVAPTKVAGDLCRTSFHNLLGGFDTRAKREWVHYEWSAGGNGAFAEDDGPSVMAPIDWGDLVTVQSTEVMELRMPLLVESSRLAIDSGGAGRTRGGLSMQRGLRVLAPEARYSLLADGAIVPAFGVLGGMSGFPVGAWIDRNGEIEDFDSPGKISGHHVEEHAMVMIRSAGGGGYGDPLERDPERVAVDVAEGYVSEQAARQLYGVVLRPDGSVDMAGSERARRRLLDQRFRITTVSTDDTFEAGAVSRRRVIRLNPQDAAAMGVVEDDLIEMDAGLTASLRGWVRVDADVPRGALPIDARACAIMKIEVGDKVELRRILSAVRPRVLFADAAE
jgi:N-methylhydantoinase B